MIKFKKVKDPKYAMAMDQKGNTTIFELQKENEKLKMLLIEIKDNQNIDISYKMEIEKITAKEGGQNE